MNRRVFFRRFWKALLLAVGAVACGGTRQEQQLSTPGGGTALFGNPLGEPVATSVTQTEDLWGLGTGAAIDVRSLTPGKTAIVLVPHGTAGTSNAEFTLLTSTAPDYGMLTISARNNTYILQQITSGNAVPLPIIFAPNGGTASFVLQPNGDVEIWGSLVIDGVRYT